MIGNGSLGYKKPATSAKMRAPATELPVAIGWLAAPVNSKGWLGRGIVLFTGGERGLKVVETTGIADGAVPEGGRTYTVVVTLGVQGVL